MRFEMIRTPKQDAMWKREGQENQGQQLIWMRVRHPLSLGGEVAHNNLEDTMTQVTAEDGCKKEAIKQCE